MKDIETGEVKAEDREREMRWAKKKVSQGLVLCDVNTNETTYVESTFFVRKFSWN